MEQSSFTAILHCVRIKFQWLWLIKSLRGEFDVFMPGLRLESISAVKRRPVPGLWRGLVLLALPVQPSISCSVASTALYQTVRLYLYWSTTRRAVSAKILDAGGAQTRDWVPQRGHIPCLSRSLSPYQFRFFPALYNLFQFKPNSTKKYLKWSHLIDKFF
jgi:hypothetical protein